MSLHVQMSIAARGVDLAFELADGETLAIMGPNGAGKSSVLDALAGVVRPDAGRAVLDGSLLFDLGNPGSGTVWRPAHSRGIALLAQEALLFPHLSVLDNVAFGPRSTGAGRQTSREVARQWLAEVDAAGFEDRRPAALSGGQAQRIAVARALAARPQLLMMDEPMAALDITIVPAVRQMLGRVLQDRTAVIVTHDVLDALLLADRVIVMEDGQIAEQGRTTDVLTRPRSEFGASLAGLNLLRGRAIGGAVETASGMTVEGLSGQPIADGEPVVAVFSPSAVGVFPERPVGSPRNAYRAAILELEPRGAQIRVRADQISADVTVPVVAELGLAPGAEVYFVVKASEVAIYPA